MQNVLYEEIDRLSRENKILTAKTTNSLANNLCPDHRDKQAGKSCLACEIDRLKKVNGKLLKAAANIVDDFDNWGEVLQSGPSDEFGEYGPSSAIEKLRAAIQKAVTL